MNARNYDLFFNEDAEETIYVTLTDEDGTSINTEIIAAIEIEELNKEYVAAQPIEESDEFEEGQLLLLHYSEDANGDPVFAFVENEEEAEIARAALEQFLTEDDEEEDDDDYDEENYLDDISDLFPGVSIKKD